MSDVFDMENFKTTSTNTLLLDFYRAQYQGVARCNLSIAEIPKLSPDTVMSASLQNRLIGELKFLRAMYYFRLVRVFGGVPNVLTPIYSDADWKQVRATKDEIYSQIISDLTDANTKLWRKSQYSSGDLGRATKGAAQAMVHRPF